MHRFQLGWRRIAPGRSNLTAQLPLRLSTMNCVSATLVEPAEQPDQQDDGDRYPDQPEQKTSTHCVLLLGLPT